MSAWLILLAAFTLFCALLLSSLFMAWRYYTTATIPVAGSLLRSHVNAGVVIQMRGQVAASSVERLPTEYDPCPTSPDICAQIVEGESIRTRREAGYGPVASLVLPDTTHIQLWASPTGADLQLEQYQITQWNTTRQTVVLNHYAGYVRYDLASDQPYDTVDYRVKLADDVYVELHRGGSYSIYVPNSQSDPTRLEPRTSAGLPLGYEIAVRRGSAVIWRGATQTALTSGEKIQASADGRLGIPQPMLWELIPDGDFRMYQQEDMYAPTSRTWKRYGNENSPGLTEQEKNARFSVINGCKPETPDLCSQEQQVQIGQFRRDGGQTRPYTIGIEQKLDVDVSEYTSLRLRAWVRVLQQSVPGTGAQGSECPIMIHLVYKPTSPTDQEQPRYFCVYTATPDTPQLADLEVIRYRPVPAYTWYLLDIELRDDSLIKQARYIQTLRIEARGHDYLTEITGLSLIGQQ